LPVQKTDIEQFLELSQKYPVIDVRSPIEFNHAHIPGAYNIPLFTDEQRKVVGTTYKQEGREKAIKKGLEYFGPEMNLIVEQAESIVISHSKKIAVSEFGKTPQPGNKTILLHCWRGGMRSDAIAWLLNVYGFKVYLLTGGYKKFRRYILDSFSYPFQFKILGGYTGSGKTELLKTIRQNGEKTVDLEGLANHKGSAFGNIGMPAQPGQEMFENYLGLELRKQLEGVDISNFEKQNGQPSDSNCIWIEDESQRIGQVNIPHEFWKTMRVSPVFFLDIPFEVRLEHVVREYGGLDLEKLEAAIDRITQKLGSLNAKKASELLKEGKINESFEILLRYYDRVYLKALHNRETVHSLLHTIECKSISPENASQLTKPFHPEKI